MILSVITNGLDYLFLLTAYMVYGKTVYREPGKSNVE